MFCISCQQSCRIDFDCNMFGTCWGIFLASILGKGCLEFINEVDHGNLAPLSVVTTLNQALTGHFDKGNIFSFTCCMHYLKQIAIQQKIMLFR